MPSKATKLLTKLRQTKRNWDHGDLHTILKDAGFEYRESGHRVYRHPEFPELGSYPIPRDDGLAPAYAKDVLSLVEKVLELKEDKDHNGK